MPYHVLSHTADTGIEATAPSLPGLIEELATAMFATMARVRPAPGLVVESSVEAVTVEDLVVDVLADLLYQSETENLILTEFEVRQVGPAAVHVTAAGAQIATAEVLGPPIKAVTYHDLVVAHDDDGWYGRVFFDV